MKSSTHHVFSLGLILFVISFFGYPNLVTLVLAIVATFLTNVLIDDVGHSNLDGVSRRRWLTHSVITAPFWGAGAWALTMLVPALFLGVFPSLPLLWWWVNLGFISGWSHLLLDALTEGGVFAFGFKRRALAHCAYDNAPLNVGFSFLGFMLFLVALLP